MGIYGMLAELKYAISTNNLALELKTNNAINAYWYHGVRYYH